MPCKDGTGPLGLGPHSLGMHRCCRMGLCFCDDYLVGDEDLKKNYLEFEIKRIENYKKLLEKSLEDIQKETKN